MVARRRVLRPLGAAVLAVLLLLPLAFSGHSHAGDPVASRSCGACIAVRHSPSLGPAVVCPSTPRLVAVALHPVAEVASSTAPLPRRLGRAPPVPVLVALA